MTSAGKAGPYDAIGRTVAAAARAATRAGDELGKARALTDLLAALHEQVVAVAAERDAVLTAVLAEQPRPSNRALAADLGLSRQRVDQLAAQSRAGGRPRSLRQPKTVPRKRT